MNDERDLCLRRGWFPYRGMATMQHPDAPLVFNNLIERIRPSTVIEIGTAQAGLTLIVRDLLNHHGLQNTPLISYDVYPSGKEFLERDGKSQGIDCRVENIFDYKKLLPEKEQEIRNMIQRDGITLVLCDGGSKHSEFAALTPFLKSGDIIMGHDYYPDKSAYDSMTPEDRFRNGIWNWCEIWDDIIAPDSGFIPFMQDEFAPVAWVCKRKL